LHFDICASASLARGLEAERVFGLAIRTARDGDYRKGTSQNKHIKEDAGGIVPSVADWLSRIRPESWMSRGYSLPQAIRQQR